MKRLFRNCLAGLALGAGGISLTGCGCYRELVDPCWPERYNAQARNTTREIFDTQAMNGHVLDQTIWNYEFEIDPKTGGPTAVLTPAGMEHLKYLSRRRPCPDPRIYLQMAQVVPGGAVVPLEKFASARADLDGKRAAAVQAYLAAITSGRDQAVPYEVLVHDPAEVGIRAQPIAGSQPNPVTPGSIPRLYNNFQGVLPASSGIIGAGGNSSSGGGGSSGSSSGGGSN